MEKALIDLARGEQGVVAGFDNGHMLSRRLESMGIRTGKTICRNSSQLMGGPVVVSVDGRQSALGRGLAAKVRVRVLPASRREGSVPCARC